MVTGHASRALCNELVRANLGTCFVYAGLAKTELKAGRVKLAERFLGLARSSHGAMLRFLAKVEDEKQRNEIRANLVHLEEKLAVLYGQLNPDRV
jgi:hypothetical protein